MNAQVTNATCYLVVNGAADAIAFYGHAFGATEIFRMTDPADGRVGHAELRFGDTIVMIADEYPDFGALGPDTIGGSPVTMVLTTDAVDELVRRAVADGATLLRAPADQSYGERVAQVLDPFGHRWTLNQRIEEVSPDEMQRRWEAETSA
ncbi:MAG: VOC family protein [Sphingomonas sp.]|nr:VOC family protein [Sphingomonas sp.]